MDKLHTNKERNIKAEHKAEERDRSSGEKLRGMEEEMRSSNTFLLGLQRP